MSGRASSAEAGSPRVPVVLALGSNLGDRRGHLEGGIAFLAKRLDLCAVSRAVESRPWGPITRQPDFLNVVVRGRTQLEPLDLLEVLQAAERSEGRRRVEPQGPRTLDVDLIFYGELRLEHPQLVVPHPKWRERPFVRDLLGDVAGSLTDPVSGLPLAELAGGALSGTLREVEPIDAGRTLSGTARC